MPTGYGEDPDTQINFFFLKYLSLFRKQNQTKQNKKPPPPSVFASDQV